MPKINHEKILTVIQKQADVMIDKIIASDYIKNPNATKVMETLKSYKDDYKTANAQDVISAKEVFDNLFGEITPTSNPTPTSNSASFGSSMTGVRLKFDTPFANIKGAKITAKEVIIYESVKFACSQSTLDAPDIYLPAENVCVISSDCILKGNIHYGEDYLY